MPPSASLSRHLLVLPLAPHASLLLCSAATAISSSSSSGKQARSLLALLFAAPSLWPGLRREAHAFMTRARASGREATGGLDGAFGLGRWVL
jgi:hypothetical protein